MAARSPLPAPPSLVTVSRRVERHIDALFCDERTRWSAVDPNLDEPLQVLEQLIGAGGKRLRPAFCYWAFVAAGGDPEDANVTMVGAAFELLHAFALVHDDIMDASPTRRGQPTVHVVFEEQHQAQTWRGDADRFGASAAILIGDLAHVYADLLLERASAATPERDRAEVAAVWQELRLELSVGQYLDVLGTAKADRDPATARRIARYKSGKYTIERPLHAGAALAGRLSELNATLSAYGDPLGEAFQLRDDVLGAFGEPAVTGKPVGQDIREGKPTPLLAAAWAKASGQQAELLNQVGAPELSDALVAEIQDVLVTTGALAETEGRIDRLYAQALDVLQQAGIDEQARQPLADLAEYVSFRTS